MKKKILFINGHLNAGGVEKSLVDILCNLDLEKFDVELLLLEGFGDYIKEIPKQVKVRLFDLHNTYGSAIASIKKCLILKDWKNLWIRIVFLLTKWFGRDKLRWISRTIFENKTYDCVVGFRAGIATELAAYAVHSNKKISWWHHGEVGMQEWEAKEYLNQCNKIDYVVTVSIGCKNMLLEKFPSLKNKILVIPNMLDIENIKKKADLYIPFQKKKKVIDFVTVGRLSPEKHIENAIYAAEKLKDYGHFSFRWFIVGDGEMKKNLQELILNKRLEQNVFLVGSKANPYPYMKKSDIFIHTSYVESQCLVVLEAMALGVPCVVTESVGPREFAVNEKNCILVDQNLNSLIRGIKKILSIENGISDMVKSGKETAEMFSKYKVRDRVNKLFE